MNSVIAKPVTDRRTLTLLFSQIRSSRGQANPLPLYKQLSEMGEVLSAPWGGKLITSYTLSQQILRDKAWAVPGHVWRVQQKEDKRWSSPSSRQMSKTLPLLNPPDHTRVRRAIGNIFNSDMLSLLRPRVEESVDNLLDSFTARLKDGPADFVASVSEELPVATIGQWMGLPPADYALLRTWTHDQVHTQELFPTASELATSDNATAHLRAYFAALITERRKNPGTDPVTSWIRTWDAIEDDRAAADTAVQSVALFMVLAALETTSHMLSNVVRLLVEHPHQMDLLRDHPELIPDAIDEALRYDAPIHLATRVAVMETELGGKHVPAGEMVQLMIGAAHHDPTHYTNPHVFDVRRRRGNQLGDQAVLTGLSTHLAFGAGIHYCLGSALARLEATALIASMLRRPLRLRVSAPPQWASRVAFRRIASLQLSQA